MQLSIILSDLNWTNINFCDNFDNKGVDRQKKFELNIKILQNRIMTK